MSLTFNIAIDGHSSCGKSTIAKSIAQKYGMRYIDTGAMYRAITLYFMRNDIIKNKQVDFALLSDSLDKITINFQFNSELKKSETFLNNENVESIIRGFEVSDNVSIIAQIKEVREKLILLQKAIGKSKNVVMENVLNLYSNYLEDLKNVDIDYTISLVMSVNKWITANIAFQAIYDDNAVKGFQIREALGVGLTYGF